MQPWFEATIAIKEKSMLQRYILVVELQLHLTKQHHFATLEHPLDIQIKCEVCPRSCGCNRHK